MATTKCRVAAFNPDAQGMPSQTALGRGLLTLALSTSCSWGALGVRHAHEGETLGLTLPSD